MRRFFYQVPKFFFMWVQGFRVRVRGEGVCTESKRVPVVRFTSPSTPSFQEMNRVDRLRAGEVPRGEKMLFSWTDPESYIIEYT